MLNPWCFFAGYLRLELQNMNEHGDIIYRYWTYGWWWWWLLLCWWWRKCFCCKHRNGMMILKWRAYCMGWNQSDLILWETWSVLVVVLDHFSWQPNNEPTIWGSFIPPIKMVILVMVCYCLHLLVDSVGVTQVCMYLKKSGMKDSFGIVGFHPSFP